MKVLATVFTIVCLLAVLNSLRGGAEFPISHVFPFLSGHSPSAEDWGGIAVIIITIVGIRRLLTSEKTDDNSDMQEEYEPVEEAATKSEDDSDHDDDDKDEDGES